jgi:hypothetical protein
MLGGLLILGGVVVVKAGEARVEKLTGRTAPSRERNVAATPRS